MSDYTQRRYLRVAEAAELVNARPETVRIALRSGAMHGTQRSKSGIRRVQPACAMAWAESVECQHMSELVSLESYRKSKRPKR